jgi:hypothetical protein
VDDEELEAADEPPIASLDDRATRGRRPRSEASAEAAADTGGRGRAVDQLEFGTTEREDWANGTEATTSTASANCPLAQSLAGWRGRESATISTRAAAPRLTEHLREQLAAAGHALSRH